MKMPPLCTAYIYLFIHCLHIQSGRKGRIHEIFLLFSKTICLFVMALLLINIKIEWIPKTFQLNIRINQVHYAFCSIEIFKDIIINGCIKNTEHETQMFRISKRTFMTLNNHFAYTNQRVCDP